MLIIAGPEDKTCFPEHSDKLFEKMKQVGNTVDYFKIEGMRHDPAVHEIHLINDIITAWLGKLDRDQDQTTKFQEIIKDSRGFVYQGHEGAQEKESLVKSLSSPDKDLSN